MLGSLLLGLTSFGIGYLIASMAHNEDAIDLAARDKVKFDEGFHAAMAVIRKRNSDRGRKAAARRKDRSPRTDNSRTGS